MWSSMALPGMGSDRDRWALIQLSPKDAASQKPSSIFSTTIPCPHTKNENVLVRQAVLPGDSCHNRTLEQAVIHSQGNRWGC